MVPISEYVNIIDGVLGRFERGNQYIRAPIEKLFIWTRFSLQNVVQNAFKNWATHIDAYPLPTEIRGKIIIIMIKKI